MMKTVAPALLALFLAPSLLQAEEIKGKVKSVDTDKSTVTITVDDKDQTLDVPKEAKIIRMVGKNEKKAMPEDLPGGLGGLKAGTAITITTEKKEEKDVITQIKLDGFTKKKKNDNNTQ